MKILGTDWLGKSLAIIFVVFLVALFYTIFTAPKSINLKGATWECESCQNPNLIGKTCDYPAFANVTDSYKCLITCADNSTIVTQCLKERLVRYNEVKK